MADKVPAHVLLRQCARAVLFLCFSLACVQSSTAQDDVCRLSNPPSNQLIAADSGFQKTLAVVSVPVVFHVVYASDGTGNVSLSQIMNQIDRLNAEFQAVGYSFYLAGVSRTMNDSWFGNLDLDSPVDAQMKQALNVDPAHVLNIYVGELLTGRGYAYYPFPHDYFHDGVGITPYHENHYFHGVVLSYTVMPGGTDANYNTGDTGVHEVGHYLGLYHTFGGDDVCKVVQNPGPDWEPMDPDKVADTPIHRRNIGCPAETQDSCTSTWHPGTDPIHNFMNYTNDLCRNTFTSGQIQRMQRITPQYRPSLGSGTITLNRSLSISASQYWKFNAVNIAVASGYQITVQGTLDAEGTTFTSTSPTTTWQGIYFGSGSRGQFSNARIERVSIGGSGAVRIYNSSPIFLNTYMENLSTGYGFGLNVSGYSANPKYRDGTIISHSGPAVYVSGDSYLSIRDTDVVMRGTSPAVEATSDGIAAFWVAATLYDGKNRLKGGRLYAHDRGIINAGEGSGSKDQNHFCDAAASSLEANTSGLVYARYNYWYNNVDPVQNNHRGSGTIYYGSRRGTSSCSGIAGLLASTGGLIPIGLTALLPDTQAEVQVARGTEDQLFEAKRHISQGRFDEALSLLLTLMDASYGPESNAALLEIGALLRHRNSPAELSVLESVVQRGGTLRPRALRVLADAYARQGRINEALRVLDSADQEDPDAGLSATMNRFFVLLSAGRHAEAGALLAEAQPGNPEEERTLRSGQALLAAESALAIPGSTAGRVQEAQVSAVMGEPPVEQEPVEAVAVYPNPFTSTVTLRYVLPEAGPVKLAVYDLGGRLVAQLVNGPREAGRHSVLFDGSELPSGVYLFRLEAPGKQESGMLLLVR